MHIYELHYIYLKQRNIQLLISDISMVINYAQVTIQYTRIGDANTEIYMIKLGNFVI